MLVIDESGMVGTRPLERGLSHAVGVGAKVVLVGDPQQLQSIEAGAAFRSLHERHGGARIDEVRLLNEVARDQKRVAGDLGEDVSLTVERGDRSFASGDRVMFLQNDRGLDAKNGTLGTIHEVSAQSMLVNAEDGRSVEFDLKDYNRLDHGYAATIHKSQGMTVDRTHVLATPGLDTLGSYVALSRHRDGLDLHYSCDDFASHARLVDTLSRDRAKDMASDFKELDPAQGFAERRGIMSRDRVLEIVRNIVPEGLSDRIGGLQTGARSPADGATGLEGEAGPGRDTADTKNRKLEGAAPVSEHIEDPEKAVRISHTKALVHHAQAFDAFISAEEAEFRTNLTYRRELTAARKAFDEVRPYGWHDTEAAYAKDPTLAREATKGRVNRTIRALQMKTELRTDRTRAENYVDRWQKLDRASERHYCEGNYDKREAA